MTTDEIERKRKRHVEWMMIAAVMALVAGIAVVVVAIVNRGDSSGDIPSAGVMSPRVSTSVLPLCAEVFRPGQVIDQAKAEAGCLDSRGGVRMLAAFACEDGRSLWQVDASTGTAAGWGFGGERYVPSPDAASDPAYAAAYEQC